MKWRSKKTVSASSIERWNIYDGIADKKNPYIHEIRKWETPDNGEKSEKE